MKIINFFVWAVALVLLTPFFSNAQEEKEELVFRIVEEMPVFPGGEEALKKFISENVKYPEEAKKNGIQGKVFVSFWVSKDGSVTHAKIARGVDPLLDKESLRVINKLPDWKPGKQRGTAVNIEYTVPINFALDDNRSKEKN